MQVVQVWHWAFLINNEKCQQPWIMYSTDKCFMTRPHHHHYYLPSITSQTSGLKKANCSQSNAFLKWFSSKLLPMVCWIHRTGTAWKVCKWSTQFLMWPLIKNIFTKFVEFNYRLRLLTKVMIIIFFIPDANLTSIMATYVV